MRSEGRFSGVHNRLLPTKQHQTVLMFKFSCLCRHSTFLANQEMYAEEPFGKKNFRLVAGCPQDESGDTHAVQRRGASDEIAEQKVKPQFVPN